MKRECRLCYGPCDPETHAATLSIRAWLKAKLERALSPIDVVKPKVPKGALHPFGFVDVEKPVAK